MPNRKPQLSAAQLRDLREHLPAMYSFRPYKPVALRSDVQARMDFYRSLPSQPDRK